MKNFGGLILILIFLAGCQKNDDSGSDKNPNQNPKDNPRLNCDEVTTAKRLHEYFQQIQFNDLVKDLSRDERFEIGSVHTGWQLSQIEWQDQIRVLQIHSSKKAILRLRNTVFDDTGLVRNQIVVKGMENCKN